MGKSNYLGLINCILIVVLYLIKIVLRSTIWLIRFKIRNWYIRKKWSSNLLKSLKKAEIPPHIRRQIMEHYYKNLHYLQNSFDLVRLMRIISSVVNRSAAAGIRTRAYGLGRPAS